MRPADEERERQRGRRRGVEGERLGELACGRRYGTRRNSFRLQRNHHFSLRPAALILPIMLHDGRQHERWTDVTD